MCPTQQRQTTFKSIRLLLIQAVDFSHGKNALMQLVNSSRRITAPVLQGEKRSSLSQNKSRDAAMFTTLIGSARYSRFMLNLSLVPARPSSLPTCKSFAAEPERQRGGVRRQNAAANVISRRDFLTLLLYLHFHAPWRGEVTVRHAFRSSAGLQKVRFEGVQG